MSSTVSSSEAQSISKQQLGVPHKEDKTQRLVRTSSLEKFRRFNSFICSQQIYVLPALLAWLKSSQSLLQSEKTIFFFRSLIFGHFLRRLYRIEFKLIVSNALALLRKQLDSDNLLRLVIYLTALVLMTELGLCFYLLCYSCVPAGLVFLIVCWFYIICLNIKTVYFHPEQGDVINKSD